jgi:hypothetical protein
MRLGTFSPRAKYGNRRIVIDGEKFDSLAEARRWNELLLLQRAGKISGLLRQVPYELVPAIPRVRNKPGQRAVTYVADFVYIDGPDCVGPLVVEDVKGVRTEVYRLKAKLMRSVHGIEITEVSA